VRRGELDRERERVEPLADVADRGLRRSVSVEMRIRITRALEEQRQGRVCPQRLDGVHVLAAQMKYCAAGDDDAQARRMREQVGEQRCRRAHMLGVVEQEQQLARP
jgi:hypothetical protein